jgi:zinc transport system permease protein
MNEFIHALTNPYIPFLRYALAIGLLSSIAFGMIGTYVVTRRISYVAGAVSHSVLGGIGLSLYLQKVRGFAAVTPVGGALVSALIAAFIIGYINMYARQREDTVIGTVWAVGMAIGLLFIAKTPGYINPMSYLFGNILLITKSDVLTVLLLDIAVIALGIVFYDQLLAVCFDEEFAQIRGIRAGVYYLLLLCLTAVTVVLMVTVVGIVMVIALLTIPPALAAFFSTRLWQMMLLSMVFCAFFTAMGIFLSYLFNLPAGTTIILVAGFVYLVALGLKALLRR